MRLRFIVRSCAVFGALFLASAAFAHNFWIAPASYSSKPGERLDVSLRLGHFDAPEEFPRKDLRIERFALITPDGTRSDIPGQDGKSPAGVVRPAAAGWNIIVYDSNNASSTLEAEKFEAYLREEGLERVIAERAKRGEGAAAGSEIYSRCAKALVWVGDAAPDRSAATADRTLGLKLELIAQQSPASLKAGEELPVLLLHDGKPVEGVKVVAINAAHAHGASEGRTDKDGRVTLRLLESGAWLIHAVHMTRLPDDHEADWESAWASLTFEIR